MIELVGDLDRSSAPQFIAAVRSVLSDHARELIIDLTAVDFVDLGGARAVIDALRSGAEIGVPVTMAHPPRHLETLFEVLAAPPDTHSIAERRHRR